MIASAGGYSARGALAAGFTGYLVKPVPTSLDGRIVFNEQDWHTLAALTKW